MPIANAAGPIQGPGWRQGDGDPGRDEVSYTSAYASNQSDYRQSLALEPDDDACVAWMGSGVGPSGPAHILFGCHVADNLFVGLNNPSTYDQIGIGEGWNYYPALTILPTGAHVLLRTLYPAPGTLSPAEQVRAEELECQFWESLEPAQREQMLQRKLEAEQRGEYWPWGKYSQLKVLRSDGSNWIGGYKGAQADILADGIDCEGVVEVDPSTGLPGFAWVCGGQAVGYGLMYYARVVPGPGTFNYVGTTGGPPDDLGPNHYRPSLAYEPNGNPHIASGGWTTTGRYNASHAYHNGTEWTSYDGTGDRFGQFPGAQVRWNPSTYEVDVLLQSWWYPGRSDLTIIRWDPIWDFWRMVGQSVPGHNTGASSWNIAPDGMIYLAYFDANCPYGCENFLDELVVVKCDSGGYYCSGLTPGTQYTLATQVSAQEWGGTSVAIGSDNQPYLVYSADHNRDRQYDTFFQYWSPY